jgi:RNA polymerase III subunit RPC82 helix-turn-helix domain
VQCVVRYLLRTGAGTLREVRDGAGLSHKQVCQALLALLQHSFVRALLREELAAANRLQAQTVYQVRSR